MRGASRALAIVAFTSLVGCPPKSSGDDAADYKRCSDNGIAYFKEIGSYPTLSDGRLAVDVVAERCSRAPKTAFPDP